MMKVFKATRKGSCGYDKIQDMIILASSEMEAMLIVAEEAPFEAKPSEFTFEEVDMNSPGILCKHIKYG